MRATNFLRNTRYVVEIVSDVKTRYLISLEKNPHLRPSGVNPKGARCTVYQLSNNQPIMSVFASANTQCEANKRVRFLAKSYLQKLMKKRKPVVTLEWDSVYRAKIFKDGAYHHGYGLTIEEAVAHAKRNIENLGKVLDEIIDGTKYTPGMDERCDPVEEPKGTFRWFLNLFK